MGVLSSFPVLIVVNGYLRPFLGQFERNGSTDTP